MPVYYNYAPKRDIPRKSSRVEKSERAQAQFDLEEYPYNDPYNTFYFSERGAVSQMGGLCTLRKTDNVYSKDYGLMDYGNMEEFDDAGTTFCIEPVKVTELGEWNFLCTRNNNFSNRSQKGTLQVSNSAQQWVSATS